MMLKKTLKRFFRNNGLTLVLLSFFLIILIAQAYTGWLEYAEELAEKGTTAYSFFSYLGTYHFLEATFENWESEFLQMSIYVYLSVWLFQKGSAESKDPEKKSNRTDRVLKATPKSPWPVRKGGLFLKIYSNSLSLAFAFLFLISFGLHFYGSLGLYNKEQKLMYKPTETAATYILNKRFWFESFQNWQSEFLAVASVVFLTIYLRQKGSPESKPVDAPHEQTGK